MIHYHGTPCGGRREDVARFLAGRHALISFARPEDIGTASAVCESFVIDNGAFTAWKTGKPITDWTPYYDFCEEWYRHPAFDWALIPDVIDGNESDNDALIDEWPGHIEGVPIWHLHESLDRLDRLSKCPRIALGSSGQWPDPGAENWWERISEAMSVICDSDGRPRCKLHGLRMLNREICVAMPLASADSTNAVQNGTRKANQCGCNDLTGKTIIADGIESWQSADLWAGAPKQLRLFAESF